MTGGGRGSVHVPVGLAQARKGQAAERLRRILEHERRLGYSDRAVMGGLDEFLFASARELAWARILTPMAGRPYAALTPAERRAWAGAVAARLGTGEPVVAPQPVEQLPRPAPGPVPLRQVQDTREAPPPSRVRKATYPPVAPPAALSLSTPLPDIPFINRASRPKFAKIGVETLRDLVWHFPDRHIDYSAATKIVDLEVDRDVTVIATVRSTEVLRIGPPPGAARVLVSDGTGLLTATFFRQAYLADRLRPGTKIALSGKVYEFRGRAHMENPEYEALRDLIPAPWQGEGQGVGRQGEGDRQRSGAPSQLTHAANLLPIYPSTESLPQRTIRNATRKALDAALPQVKERVPEDILRRHGMPGLARAVEDMHYPRTVADKEAARRRLAFDELFINQLAVVMRRAEWRERGGGVAVPDGLSKVQGFLASLDYALTTGQRQALADIFADMASGVPMGRLLQGEVGSGKTVVAVAALLAAAATGCQGALMAPTEVLAEQHFLSTQAQLRASPVFGMPDVVREADVPGLRNPSPSQGEGQGVGAKTVSFSAGGDDVSGPAASPGGYTDHLISEKSAQPLFRPVRIALLIGSLTTAVKSQVQKLIAAGEVDIVIGTHALLQEAVEFPRLALSVVDEQHRFGVEQRAALAARLPRPHLLAMSATPIPRSLSLTLYGDLDISTLRDLPGGRLPIKTAWARSADDRTQAYELVRSEAAAGRQSFIVCPLIEPSEELFARAATTEFERLRLGELAGLRLGLLHGRMGLAEKQAVMDAMRAGKIDALVATPVIEVGVDIPNATVMLIESADRFGLAQLHQFRGRVGRGGRQSHCILLSDDPSDGARERLSVVGRVSDGFELAEEDLRLRGPGDYIGTRQSGWADLMVATLSDVDLLQFARREAQDLLARDPALALPEHAPLAAGVKRITEGRPAGVS